MEVIGRGCERVVVAIDSASLALSALEAAFVLAAGAHVPLAILFVVDLRLAVHPPATEPIPAAEASAQAAPTFPARAHADSWDAEPVTFRAQAQHVRRLALGMAQRFAVAWSMDTVRGELVPAALAALGPGDALVLHRGPLARFTLSEAAPLQALAGRPVLTLVDASAAVPRALRAAAAMARVIGSELLVLGAAPFQSPRSAARTVVADGEVALRYGMLPSHEASDLAAVARAEESAAFVLPAGWRPSTAWVTAMLNAIECPLVVIRAAPPSA